MMLVLSARVEFNELFFFKMNGSKRHTLITVKARCKQCKTVKEWNTHLYSFDMPKTRNFMADTNTELYKSTTAETCDFQSPT